MIMKTFKPRCKATIKEEKNDRRDILDYRPIRIKDGLNSLCFLGNLEYTADSIHNEIILLLSWLNMSSMFQIPCWYNNGHDDQNKVENIAIRCSNCGNKQWYICIILIPHTKI